MILTERHVIKEGHKYYKVLDNTCFLSKNLYNSTLYLVRGEFLKNGVYRNYYYVQKLFQDQKQNDYVQLPAKVSQQTMKLVDQNFRSFFRACQDYKVNPGKYLGRPKIPKYLDPAYGRFVVTYTSQAVSHKEIRKGYIVLSGLKDVRISTKVSESSLVQVRLVPHGRNVVVEVLYEVPDVSKKSDNGRYASIDLGVSNLATVTTNTEVKPFIISGRRVKSINQGYNKLKARYQSLIPKNKKRESTKRLRHIEQLRENRINDYLHKASRFLANYLVSRNINTLIVGNNEGWKQNTNMGSVSNQNFVQIPFHKFIWMLRYKCDMCGINLEVIREEYTSKCSFLDQESIGKHRKYCGKRISRGMFVSGSGRRINADVNGSYNILRKCKPNVVFNNGVQGVVVHPEVLYH